MALLPEGITELLHHEKLAVPLVCILKLKYCTCDAVYISSWRMQLMLFMTCLNFCQKIVSFQIKCQNVIIFTATNATELDKEWDCLIELTRSCGFLPTMVPYVSKHLQTNLSDVRIKVYHFTQFNNFYCDMIWLCLVLELNQFDYILIIDVCVFYFFLSVPR
jgi:hypothetical protein